MRKIILNKGYGGFDPSWKAYKEYAKRKGLTLFFYLAETTNDPGNKYVCRKADGDANEDRLFFYVTTEDLGECFPNTGRIEGWLNLNEGHREDPDLIAVVEELGNEASSKLSHLVVVEVPDEVAEDYVIGNYDGWETLLKRVEVY